LIKKKKKLTGKLVFEEKKSKFQLYKKEGKKKEDFETRI
jgi:hypothetical protein